MKKTFTLFITLILVFTLGACTPKVEEVENPYINRYSFYTDEFLDTATRILIYYEDGFDINGLRTGINEILERTHNIYDSHSDDSEVGQVNLTAHVAPVEVSDELFEVIRQSILMAEESNGAYDPTITPLVELWAIDDDSKWSDRDWIPTEVDIQKALLKVDYTKVILNEEAKTVFFTEEGISLDLGGISKGYISQLLKEYVEDSGVEHAIINVGNSSQIPIGTRCAKVKDANGNIVFIEGPNGDQVEAYEVTNDPWIIGTSDPFDLLGFNPPVGVFKLQNVGLSSSGSATRYFILDDHRYHHIFDTKTGYPTDNELIVIQVLSEDIVGIDALSTFLFAMGLDEAMAYVEAHEGLEAIFVTVDKEIYLSTGIENYDVISEEYTLK